MTADATALHAVLFDIDGTLIDSNMLHVKAWSRAFAEEGHDIGDDAIHAQIGKGGDKLLPALLPEGDDDTRSRIDKRQGEIFTADYLDQARPFPRAADLLRRVSEAGKQVVLASSAKQSEVDHYIGLLGVADIIATTTSIDDVARSKPDPAIFASALRKIGLEPSAALVIGDTIWDVEAARQTGLETIALLSGGVPAAALEDAGAIAVYDDVAQLLIAYDRSCLAR